MQVRETWEREIVSCHSQGWLNYHRLHLSTSFWTILHDSITSCKAYQIYTTLNYDVGILCLV